MGDSAACWNLWHEKEMMQDHICPKDTGPALDVVIFRRVTNSSVCWWRASHLQQSWGLSTFVGFKPNQTFVQLVKTGRAAPRWEKGFPFGECCLSTIKLFVQTSRTSYISRKQGEGAAVK